MNWWAQPDGTDQELKYVDLPGLRNDVPRHGEARGRTTEVVSGDRSLECDVLNNLGETYGASGETAHALNLYERALSLAAQLGVRSERARAHHGIARALVAGDPGGRHRPRPRRAGHLRGPSA